MTTTIEIPDGIDPVDLKALRLAVEKVRSSRDKRDREQIEEMIAEREWRDVAEFAAFSCQMNSLHLKPWQTPPCHVEDENEPCVGEEEAAKLLRRMLKAGVSRWHPDPLRALEEREKA